MPVMADTARAFFELAAQSEHGDGLWQQLLQQQFHSRAKATTC